MEGGLLTSMLIGGGVGAATQALTGGDPLKGFLLGGAGGALTGGIGGGAAGGGASGGSTSPLASAGAAAAEEATKAGITALPGASAVNAANAASSAMGGTGTGIMPNAAGQFTSGVGFQAPMAGTISAPGAMGGAGSGLQVAGAPLSGLPSTMDATQLASVVANPLEGVMPDVASTATSVGATGAGQSPTSLMSDFKQWWSTRTPGERLAYSIGVPLAGSMLMETVNARKNMPGEEEYKGPLSKFKYDPSRYVPSLPFADGGITTLGGGNIAVGGDPRRNMPPISQDNPATYGWQNRSFPSSAMAEGGIASLGSYSDGGRLLKGPGDGMSDNIPAMIGRKQPARLAEGEFVVPADVVSHLGNGSTDAGAKQLYSMMDKVRRARTGRKSQGREINPRRYMPA